MKDITVIVNILQFVGGLWLTLGYIPQIFKTLKTKKVEDLSIAYYINIFGGIVLMEIYALWNAIALHSGTMFAVTNSISLLCSGTMLVLTFAYSRPRHIEKMKQIETSAMAESIKNTPLVVDPTTTGEAKVVVNPFEATETTENEPIK